MGSNSHSGGPINSGRPTAAAKSKQEKGGFIPRYVVSAYLPTYIRRKKDSRKHKIEWEGEERKKKFSLGEIFAENGAKLEYFLS